MKKLLFVLVLFSACKQNKQESTDYLPSFNDGLTKASIVHFIDDVIDPTSDNYVNPEDRIVCFDNDGTLWVEQPLPTQFYFTIDRIKELAKSNPEIASTMPYKAVVENGVAGLEALSFSDILKIIGKANAYEAEETFDAAVSTWIDTTLHPVYNKPIAALVYQPMLELLHLLQRHDFQIYIVSGGSQEFIRPWANHFYKIPKQHVIGSVFKTTTAIDGEEVKVQQTEELLFGNDHTGKVLSIQRFIGKKPIMVIGNSDGDLEMMEYAATDQENVLCVYLNHTDGEREYLYDDSVRFGQLEKGLTVAKEKGWTIIDMKKDWNEVFAQ